MAQCWCPSLMDAWAQEGVDMRDQDRDVLVDMIWAHVRRCADCEYHWVTRGGWKLGPQEKCWCASIIQGRQWGWTEDPGLLEMRFEDQLALGRIIFPHLKGCSDCKKLWDNRWELLDPEVQYWFSQQVQQDLLSQCESCPPREDDFSEEIVGSDLDDDDWGDEETNLAYEAFLPSTGKYSGPVYKGTPV